MKHFVGGGIFTGFLWLYLIRRQGWNFSILLEWASLYALVCALGVAVELAELAGTKSGVLDTGPFDVDTTDTSWDLLANTLGALTFWVVYRLFVSRQKV